MPIRFAFALLSLVVLTAQTHAARITFVLVNDIYQMSEQAGADGKMRGGFARLAAVVKAERAKGNPVVFAHGGDTLSPSLMSGLDRGAHIIALTNLIRPDIFVPGNHEFDFGKAVFLQRMAEARFPIYAANLRGPDGRTLPGLRDSTIVTLAGIKVGLIGATYDDSPRASHTEDLNFLPTVATVKERAEALKKDGADFIVTVTHATREQDDALLGSRVIDLLLTGHTHDLTISFDGRSAHVESSYDAQYVVAVDVDIDVQQQGGRRHVVWWPNFRVIDTAGVTPDAEVLAAVQGFEQELTREMDVALGTTAVELDSRNITVRGREAAIGNLIADAMRDATGADAAIMNGGGIRAGKTYAPGSAITRRDILAELPFGNRTVVVKITGRDLRAALENGLRAWPQGGGRFPQVSGMTVEADSSRPAGSRITSLSVGGAPADDARVYTVAVNDFIARGGDGYVQFRDAVRVLPDDDAPLLANQVMVHVRKLGTVRTGVEGRVVLK
jgi:2',3'-cyclic-nucleotide 2'-phosphodiesterase (5'-nucleotidase family)